MTVENVEVLEKEEIEEKVLEKKNQIILAEASAIKVVDQETYEKAGEYLKALKNASNQIEGYWAEPKSNAHKSWKAICTKESEMLKPIENAQRILKKEIGDYLLILEKEKEELEQKARQEYGTEVVLESAVEKVKGISSSLTYEAIIENPKEIPYELAGVILMIPNEKIINQLIKSSKGKIQIPGVKIVEKKVVSVRG